MTVKLTTRSILFDSGMTACNYDFMATKKQSRKAARPRPDRYSKKRSGYVNQTLRLTTAENKLIREASGLDSSSINFWATRILVTAAKAQIAKKNKQLTSESE
jgi:hypothetical protein